VARSGRGAGLHIRDVVLVRDLLFESGDAFARFNEIVHKTEDQLVAGQITPVLAMAQGIGLASGLLDHFILSAIQYDTKTGRGGGLACGLAHMSDPQDEAPGAAGAYWADPIIVPWGENEATAFRRFPCQGLRVFVPVTER